MDTLSPQDFFSFPVIDSPQSVREANSRSTSLEIFGPAFLRHCKLKPIMGIIRKAVNTMRSGLRSLFGKRNTSGYACITEEKIPSDLFLGKEKPATDLTDSWGTEPHRLDPTIDGRVKDLVSTWLKRGIRKGTDYVKILDDFCIAFDGCYVTLYRDAKLCNLKHPMPDRIGCLMPINGIGARNQDRFTSEVQSEDARRKVGCFNIHSTVRDFLDSKQKSKEYIETPMMVEYLERASRSYDMRKATEFAEMGGVALIHTAASTTESGSLESWSNLMMEHAGRPVPLIRRYIAKRVGGSVTYDEGRDRYLEWYRTNVLEVNKEVVSKKKKVTAKKLEVVNEKMGLYL